FVVVSIALMFLAASIAERAEAEERFTKAFRSSPDALLICRARDGQIIEINERCERMFAQRRSETIGRTISELNLYTSDADKEKLLAGTSERTGLHDLELCLRTKTGDLRYALVSADMDDIGGEDCFIIVIRDVTDRKRAEEAQQNLAHASRLAVVGE